MSGFNYIQLPPDGSGKKSKQTVISIISYISGSISFEIGDTLVTDVGFQGTVIDVDGTTATGSIHVRTLHDSVSASIPDGSALKVNAVTKATSSGDTDIVYNQDVVITGGNNPLNKVAVTEQGALLTQAPSGMQQFDAFGKLMTSESSTIREYQPVYDTLPDEFNEVTAGAGTITWNDTRHVVDMSIGDQDGDYSQRRSNLYHKYQTGIATTVMMTVFLGSANKTNAHAHIGLFDDKDGVFFGLEGESINVVLRSSVSGSVVNTPVPQAEWNVDRLDGSETAFNISRKQINPLAIQILFIDFQWLGGGRIRYGFVIDGEYIVCHEINSANNISNPYMRTGSLPLTYELYNDGTPNPASPSNLYCVSAAIKCEGKFLPKEYLSGGSLPPAANVPANDGSEYYHIGSLKPARNIGLGPEHILENITDLVIETGQPSTLTSHTVDFSNYAEPNDIMRVEGSAFNNKRAAYIVQSVTSGSPSTITLSNNRGIMFRESPANATIKIGKAWENRAVTIPTSISLSDVSEGEKHFLIEVVKNPTLIAPTTGVETTESIVAGADSYIQDYPYTVTGGTGSGCMVQCDVTGGQVTAVYIARCGDGYTIGDTLTIVGGSNDATFDVLTVASQEIFWVDNFPGNSIVAALGNGLTNIVDIDDDGVVLYSSVVKGDALIDLSKSFGYHNELMIRKADIDLEPNSYSVRVKTFDPTYSPDIYMSVSWREIR